MVPEVKVSVIQSCLTLRPHGTHQSPLSMEFSRQEYCIGLPFPSPGALPDPGIELGSPALQADSLLSGPPVEPSVSWSVLKFTSIELMI